MSLIIRYAYAGDIDSVAELFELLNIDNIPPAYRLTRKYSEEAIARQECFVAVIDEDVVGAMRLVHRVPNTYEIEMLSVDSAFQRRGVGRALVERALTFAYDMRAKGVYLGTMDDYKAADFYRRLGMEEISDRKHHPTCRFFRKLV